MCYNFFEIIGRQAIQLWFYDFLIYLFLWSNKDVFAIHFQLFAFLREPLYCRVFFDFIFCQHLFITWNNLLHLLDCLIVILMLFDVDCF